MKVSYILEEKDLLLAQREAQKRCKRAITWPWYSQGFLYVGGIAIGVAFVASIGMYQMYSGRIAKDFSIAFVPFCVGMFLLICYARLAKSVAARTYLRLVGPFPLHQSVTLTDRVVDVEGPNGRVVLPVERLVSCYESSLHVFIVFRPWSIVTIPKVAFPSPTEVATFRNHVNALIGA